MRALVVVAALAAVAAADAPADLVQFSARADGDVGWKKYADKRGVVMYKRAVAGSSYYEHRAVVELAAVDARRAADEVWDAILHGDMDSLKHRDILKSAPEGLVIYDQIRTPVVSDRDYTILVRRIEEPGRVTVRTTTANQLGPPPARGYVRIPVIAAGWRVEDNGRGGTRLHYYAYSEPGGSVPAWMVRGAQADRSLADVVRMVARLQRLK